MTKPLIITGDVRLRLEKEAELRASLTCYKHLAEQTGLTTNYVAQVIGKMIRAKRHKVDVSRGP